MVLSDADVERIIEGLSPASSYKSKDIEDTMRAMAIETRNYHIMIDDIAESMDDAGLPGSACIVREKLKEYKVW